jgi:TPR repeat protein
VTLVKAGIFILFILSLSLPTKAQTLDEAKYFDYLTKAHLALKAKQYSKAVEQYQLSAKWGDKDSQYYLAQLYLRGQGVKQNTYLGLAWLFVAAEAHKQWSTKADKYFQSLTPQERLKVKAITEKFLNLYGQSHQRIRCQQLAISSPRSRTLVCRKQLHTATYVYDQDGQINGFVFLVKAKEQALKKAFINWHKSKQLLGAEKY